MKILREGEKVFGDSRFDGGVRFILLENGGEEDAELILHLNLNPYYRGPGLSFREVPYIKRTKRKILIRSRWGYDI